MVDNERAIPALPSQESIAECLLNLESHKAIKESNGAAYESRMFEKNVHLYIFLKNASEVIEHLDGIRSSLRSGPDIELDISASLLTAQFDLSRKMFNFLSSSAMLIDYTRAFMCKHYCETELMESYLELLRNQVKEDPLCVFIKELRNLGIHKCIPIHHVGIVRSEDYAHAIDYFDPDDLLSQWSKWNSGARDYINNMKNDRENFTITGTVNKYVQKIRKLHRDTDELLKRHHKKDISELTRLRESHQSKYHAAWPNWPMSPIESFMPPMDQL